MKETHCLDTSADYTVTCPPGDSLVLQLTDLAPALPMIQLRERKMRGLARGGFFFFSCTGENYKTAMRGAQETAAMFVATVDHLLSTIFTRPRQMRDSASSDKTFKHLTGDCCGLKDGL